MGEKGVIFIKLKVLVFIFSIFSLSAFSQSKTSYDGVVSFELNYGYKIYNQNFNNSFNTLNNFESQKPIQTLGLVGGGYLKKERGGNVGHFLSFHQVIPQEIKINDSINSKVTGFSAGQAVGQDLLKKRKNVDVLICLGYNIGRTRFFENEFVRQKNFFISPKISLQPKFGFKYFAVSITIEYEYDFTKTTWSKTLFANNEKIGVSNFRQSGLTVACGIGYRFGKS